MIARVVGALLVALVVGPAAAGEMSGAALDYALNCQGCHRADGAGTPGSVPALAGSVGRFTRVAGGREYLARVPGVAQAPLDDAGVAGVLNWMLARFGGADVGRDFAPYTGDEIGRLRRRPLIDVDGVRRTLLDAIARDAPGRPPP